MGAELFHADPWIDGRRDGYDVARCRYVHFCERAWKLLLGQEFKAHSHCNFNCSH